jgi:hypothetical protein
MEAFVRLPANTEGSERQPVTMVDEARGARRNTPKMIASDFPARITQSRSRTSAHVKFFRASR